MVLQVTAIIDAPTETRKNSCRIESRFKLDDASVEKAVLQYQKYVSAAKQATKGDASPGALYLMAARVAAEAGLVERSTNEQDMETLVSTEKSESRISSQLNYASSLRERMLKDPPPWARGGGEVLSNAEYSSYFETINIAFQENVPTARIIDLIGIIASRLPDKDEAYLAGEVANIAKQKKRHVYLYELAVHYKLGNDITEYAYARIRRITVTKDLAMPNAEQAFIAFKGAGMHEDAISVAAEFNLKSSGTLGGKVSRAAAIINEANDPAMKKSLILFAQEAYKARGNYEVASDLVHDYRDWLLSEAEKASRAEELLERKMRAPERNRILMAMRREDRKVPKLPHQKTLLTFSEQEILDLLIRDSTSIPAHYAKWPAELRPQPQEVSINRNDFRADLKALVTRGDLQKTGNKYRLRA